LNIEKRHSEGNGKMARKGKWKVLFKKKNKDIPVTGRGGL
jgi:hypothetical protein